MNIGHDIVTVFRLGYDKSCQEGAECKRQPERLRDPCRSEAEQHNQQKKNFPVLESDNLVQSVGNYFAGREENDDETDDGLAQACQNREWCKVPRRRGLSQDGKQKHHGNDCDVLE